MTIRKCRAKVISQTELCPGIFDLRIEAPEAAEQAAAGQFLNLYLNDRSRILPRPVSICEIGADRKSLRLVYRVTGKRSGTAELAAYGPGSEISLLGPLGNGFPTGAGNGVCCVVGGGIGIPPLLELCRELPGRKIAVLGYRDRQTFLKEDFASLADRTLIASEDGSTGVRGNVLDALRAENILPDCIMACGPLPMLRALKQFAAEHEIPCYVSLEERMACGVGACLGCVVKTTATDPHSNVKNRRVCKDGPVFDAKEVDLG